MSSSARPSSRCPRPRRDSGSWPWSARYELKYDTVTVRLGSVLGSALIAVGLFVIAAVMEIMLDIEENTRASFRLQQLILAEMQEEETPHDAP